MTYILLIFKKIDIKILTDLVLFILFCLQKGKIDFNNFVARITPYHWRLLAAIWFYNKQT